MQSIRKKFWWSSVLGLLALALSAPASWAREGGIGNGGGAWVCQNNDQLRTIRWATLVDLYEATREFKLELQPMEDRLYTDIIDHVMIRRLFPVNEVLYRAIQKELEQVESNLEFVEPDLEIVDDALYRIRPPHRDCLEGIISYVQLANYTDYGKILIQKNLFEDPRLKATDKAALLIHEAVYAYLRGVAEEKDSVRTRRIVGLLFSTLPQDALNAELQTLLSREMPGAAKFAKIRAGSFLMGSPNDEVNQHGSEILHPVQITRDFEIQTTEVTQKQWFEVMGTNPSAFRRPEDCPETYQVVRGTALCPNHPVEKVSWQDVNEFIRVLNATRRDGYLYRLPTEAEWEYAARAGTSTAYSFGGDANLLPFHGWYSRNSGKQTHEVAELIPNGWGLYDMHGNVWEWVSDWNGVYDTSKKVDPKGPGNGTHRVCRGGSWYSYDVNFRGGGAGYLRSAFRYSNGPAGRYSDVGVRLVRTRL